MQPPYLLFGEFKRKFCEQHYLAPKYWSSPTPPPCAHPECDELPWFFDTNGRLRHPRNNEHELYCSYHKEEEMRDYYFIHCEHPGCGAFATCDDPDLQDGRFCQPHKKEGMQDGWNEGWPEDRFNYKAAGTILVRLFDLETATSAQTTLTKTEGWSKHRSTTGGRGHWFTTTGGQDYWVNPTTGEITWENPAAATRATGPSDLTDVLLSATPAAEVTAIRADVASRLGWSEHYDETNHQTYWYHAEYSNTEDKSSWEPTMAEMVTRELKNDFCSLWVLCGKGSTTRKDKPWDWQGDSQEYEDKKVRTGMSFLRKAHWLDVHLASDNSEGDSKRLEDADNNQSDDPDPKSSSGEGEETPPPEVHPPSPTAAPTKEGTNDGSTSPLTVITESRNSSKEVSTLTTEIEEQLPANTENTSPSTPAIDILHSDFMSLMREENSRRVAEQEQRDQRFFSFLEASQQRAAAEQERREVEQERRMAAEREERAAEQQRAAAEQERREAEQERRVAAEREERAAEQQRRDQQLFSFLEASQQRAAAEQEKRDQRFFTLMEASIQRSQQTFADSLNQFVSLQAQTLSSILQSPSSAQPPSFTHSPIVHSPTLGRSIMERNDEGLFGSNRTGVNNSEPSPPTKNAQEGKHAQAGVVRANMPTPENEGVIIPETTNRVKHTSQVPPTPLSPSSATIPSPGIACTTPPSWRHSSTPLQQKVNFNREHLSKGVRQAEEFNIHQSSGAKPESNTLTHRYEEKQITQHDTHALPAAPVGQFVNEQPPAAPKHHQSTRLRNNKAITRGSPRERKANPTRQHTSWSRLTDDDETESSIFTQNYEVNPTNFSSNSPIPIVEVVGERQQMNKKKSNGGRALKKLSTSLRAVLPRQLRRPDNKASTEIVRKHSSFINNTI